MTDPTAITPLAPSARHRQLSERVADQIREAIMVGSLRKGFLRTERLAVELGVSQTPVREALMILQAEGAVHWEPRRGFRLVPLTARDVEDLYDVQAYIAGELAARAAALMPEGSLERLAAVQVELSQAHASGNAGEVDRHNHEFHRLINVVSGSTKLTHLLSQTVRYVPLGFFEQIEGWSDASVHDHDPIIEALRGRSKPAARRTMAAHIHHIGELFVQHLRTVGVVS